MRTTTGGRCHDHTQRDHVRHGDSVIEVQAESSKRVIEGGTDVLATVGFESNGGVEAAFLFNVRCDEVVESSPNPFRSALSSCIIVALTGSWILVFRAWRDGVDERTRAAIEKDVL